MDEEVIKEVNTFSGALDASKTCIWNGAIGVFEFEKFAAGTDCAGPQGGAAGSVASN